MTGILEIDYLFLFGFAGLLILVVMLVVFFSGVWKFHKTPRVQRGENDPKLYYFILAIVLIGYLVSIRSGDYRHTSVASLVISLFFLAFMAYLQFFKKVKRTVPQMLLTGAVTLYSLFSIATYFLK